MPDTAQTVRRRRKLRCGWELLALGALGLLAALALALERPALFWDPARRPPRPAGRRAANMAAIRKANGLPAATPVVISQIGRTDTCGPLDELGLPAHWIELHNRSPRPESLAGYALADSMRQIRKWPLPGIVLPPGGHAIVWADGKAMFDAPVRFGFNNVARRDYWHRFRDYSETQGGNTYYRSNNVADAETALLAYRFHVPQPDRYEFWLRLKPLGQRNALVSAGLNQQPPGLASLRPRGQYMMVPFKNPNSADGLWPLETGRQVVRIHLLRGEVVCDSGVLVRAGAPPEEVAVHANFKPRAAGEVVALFAPRGRVADFVSFPPLPDGQTYRLAAAGGRFALGDPAPHGLPLTAPPRPSRNSGPIGPSQTLRAVPADPADIIRYTLDGSLPMENDPPFPPVLTLTPPTTVRLRSFRAGAWPGPTETRVFWPAPPPHLPLLCLATDERNLRDPHRGIMVNTHARAAYGERPAYACLIAPDGSVQETDAGLRIQGRSTRDWKVKLSFRIVCRPRYGAPTWPGPVFAGAGTTNHASFVVRSHNNVYHPLGLAILRRLGLAAPRTRHILLTVNDQPFGVYFLMEDVAKLDALEARYGHLDLDVIKHKTFGDPVILGTINAHDETWGRIERGEWGPLTTNRVAQIVDLKSFTRWIAAVQYLGVKDNDQGYFVRDRRAPDEHWSFLNWDWDGAFYDFARGKLDSFRNSPEGVRGIVFRRLMKDPGYASFYLAEFQALLNHPLAPGPWLDMVQEYENTLLPAMEFESKGRQNQRPHLSPSKETVELLRAQFESELATARAFFETRGATIRRLLSQGFSLSQSVVIRITTEPPNLPLEIDGWPETGAYAGQYFPGTPLNIRAADGRPLQFTVDGTSQVATFFETNVTKALDIEIQSTLSGH